MAAVTAAVIGAAAVASIAAGAMQADAQRKATNANRKNVKDTNALNYQMFRESRGEGGNAILPLYAPPGTEERMLGQAVRVYDSITGQPIDLTLEEYQAMVDGMDPAVEGGNDLINGIYNGQLEAERMAALNPVLQAREQAAQADAAAIDLALQEENNRIMAADAAKGYVGGSSFVNNRLLAATLAARQQAARAKAAAALTNAGDVRTLKEAGVDLRLKSLDLPVNRVNRLMELSQAPAAGLARRQQLAMDALGFFRLNPGTPPQAQAFTAPATPSMGAVIASGLAQAGGSTLSYLQNQQLIDAISKQSAAPAATVPAGNFADF
jgi:hypothetical protein